MELTRAVSCRVNIPVIASGGAGTMEHFSDAFELGEADAVLAASLFHFGEITIPELKAYLQKKRHYSQKIIKIPGRTFPGIFIDRKEHSF